MKIINVEQRSPEWNEVRRGKVTGTVLKRLVGGAKAQESAFYELVAGRLTVSDGFDGETDLNRGVRLESEAVQEFVKKTGKKVEHVGFVISDWNKNVGYSPDGLIKKGKKYPEDIEVKCLSAANHVRSWITGKVPEDYMPQVIHGFIVNDDLKTRHVVFYDPRISVKPYHVIKVEREDVEQEIEDYKKSIRDMLKRMDDELSKRIKL